MAEKINAEEARQKSAGELDYQENKQNNTETLTLSVPPSDPEDHLYDWNYPIRNIFRVAAGYYSFIICGMNDSSIGVLIPTLEPYYGLDYLLVSLAFLAPFIGYSIAALISDKIHRLIGRCGVGIMGASCQVICYIVVCTAPPFPVFVIMYGIAGFGNGSIDSTVNSWVGGLKHSNEALGLLHGCYGLGGTICPAIFTAMIGHGIRWNHCYFLLIGMGATSILAFASAFWGETAVKYKQEVEKDVTNSMTEERRGDIENSSHDVDTTVGEASNDNKIMLRVVSDRLVWMLSITLFVYLGASVSFGGWISTFMIQVRHGAKDKMGYVTTGFWAGLTVGRMTLGFLVGHFQAEDYFVIFFILVSLASVLIVWLVPVLGVSVAFTIVFGIISGPVFPTIIASALRKLPKYLHVAGVGFCVAVGGGGAALPPFINGVIANKFGPRVLGPYTVILLSLMLVMWLLILKLHPQRN
ncbi:Bsc6p [Sugiyamaella lignohabitans]|uniref:Bsc6p n=1 Tax=Sugiyamaella lignohabitans TaxID=796027 RepID=A0A167CQD1_9ASCO|nr:Bsc6p [Sugiyamaella lignohabitans]ANB11981.1 Bsc6p [Sugiyamaella lignohabitans]